MKGQRMKTRGPKLFVGLCLIAAGLSGGICARPGRAAPPIVVPTTADGGPGSLRQAILDANANPGPDVITLPAGTYTLTIPGANEDAGATGDLDITGDLTINGAGEATTVVDANNLDRAFDIHGATVTLTGVKVQNGKVTDADGGGGLRTTGVLTLD